MKISLLLTPFAAIALLAGCASGGGHCAGEFDYQRAASLPAPSVPGLAATASASALAIPPERGSITPYAQRVADAGNPKDSHMQCLDDPPKLVLTPQPAATQPAPPPAVPNHP